MPKNRGSHKNKKKQRSSAKNNSKGTKDDSPEPTDPRGTRGSEGAGSAVDAATAMRPEEKMNRHGEVMAVVQDHNQVQPLDDVQVDLQEDWLDNLPAMRPEERMNRQGEAMDVVQDQPLDDVQVDLQEDWLDNLPELTQLTLWKISEVISQRQFMPLGLKLGLPQIKIQILLDESNLVFQQEEKTFKMLYMWYSDQGGDHSKFLFQVLTTDVDLGLDPEEVFKLFSERQPKDIGFCGRSFQDLQLFDIAKEVPVDKLIPLGLRLGLTYPRITSIRVDSDGHSVDARYNMLMQWKKEQTAQIDQVETLASILEACREGRIAYKIRHNHLVVTNDGKTMRISEDQQIDGIAEIQLSVTHPDKMVRDKAQGQLQALLDAGSSEVSLVASQADVEKFLQGLKEISMFLKHYSGTIKRLERSIGRDGLYKLIGFTLDSIHFHVKVYTVEGLRCLQTDVQSGRIGRQLAEVLISAETKLQLTEDIVLDVSPEGSGAWDLVSPVGSDVLPSTSPSSASEKKESSKDDETLSSGPRSQGDVDEAAVGKQTVTHQPFAVAAGSNVISIASNIPLGASSLLPGSSIPETTIAPNVLLRQGQKRIPDDTESGPVPTTDKRYAGEVSKKMEDWSEEEVALWLKNVVQLSEDLVSKFEGVDGFTLVRYTKAELKEDFELSAGYCRRLIIRREHYLEKERMGMVISLGSVSSQSRDESSKVSTTESVDTPSPVTVEPCPLGAEEPVEEEESMQETSSFPLGKIYHRDVEDLVKKSPQVPFASSKTERDAIDSSIDMDMGYTSSYNTTPNSSEVDLPLSGHVEWKKPLYQKTEMGGKASDSNTEKKLTNLLLGSEKGEFDSSYYPVLAVNTPAQQWSSAELEEKFGFMSSVNWNVVFDCNADSNKVGLCQYVNDRKSIKILSAETFTETKDIDVLRVGIDFPEVPVWVFPNGRNDVNVKGMDKKSDMDWMRERSHAVLNTVRFFSDPGVIPTGRAVVVFFLLSDSDFMVMTQLFREFYTSKSFQDLRRFAIIAENQDVLDKWIQHLDNQSIVSSKNMRDRCLGGIPWQEINTYMMRLLGTCQTHLPELPMSPKGQCQLIKKHQSQWSDISILAKNECENTPMDESNPNFRDFVQEKESRFYQGHGVDWWNFYLSEERLNNGKGFNQVLKRQNYKKLYSDVQKILASRGKKVTHISMATVFHQAGSGGTTVAKNLLWDLHRDYRCLVVNRVTNDTVKQIFALREYGYESQNPGPVIILLENLDSDSMRPFLLNLERETRYIENDGLAFVLIHCKRTSDPLRLQKKEEPKPCVCIQHTLTEDEKQWFIKKTEDLEKRNVFSEKESPELLLAFMVMKKECDPAYLRNVVKGILPKVDNEPSKELLQSVQLLKYIAAVQIYNPEFAMPVSVCDGFMQNRFRIVSSGGRQQTYGPWEKNMQPFLNLLLLEEFIQDIDGCVKGLAIVHPIIATEIVDQLGEVFQQTPADMILELLEKSIILDTLSYSRGYIQKVCRDLMVRRLKKEYGDDRETQFSPFIEYVYSEDKAKAFKIMEVGIKKFQDPFLAQQKARLHSKKDDDPESAEQAINIALGILSSNSYLWDTRGIILRQKMIKYERKEDHVCITDCEMKELLNIFNESCSAFQKAQKVMEEETRGHNYAGFVGEIFAINNFLEIVQKRVRPFLYRRDGLETLKRYLMTEYIPPELNLPSLLEYSDTMKSLSERVDKALDRFTDYLVQCRNQGFGETKSYDDKLKRLYKSRYHFFAMSSQPKVTKYPVETAYALRRAKVQTLDADGYQQIFDMVSKSKVADLKHVQGLLRLNLDSPSLFDIKNFVFTVFALSIYTNEALDEEEARKSVNILKGMEEKDNGFYGLFFEMLLDWPDGTQRERSRLIAETIRQLRDRWTERYRKKGYKESSHNLPRRSKIRQHDVSLKPTTEFYLGLQEQNSRFVHRKSIGRVTYAIWREESIKKKLRRLDGILDSKHFVLYNPVGEEPVKIALSLPIQGLPSQEPVQFYLGFSFSGPLAYDVVYKDNRETPFIAKESSACYPSYINEIDNDNDPAGFDF